MDIGWLAVALSLAGNVLIVRKQAAGFAVWTLGNCIWIWLALARRDWAQVALFTVYSALNIWGLVGWGRRVA